MRLSRYRWVPLAWITAAALTGCTLLSPAGDTRSQAEVSPQEQNRPFAYEVPLTFFKDYTGILALYGRRFLYFNIRDDTCTFTEFDMTTARSRVVGRVSSFLFSEGSNAWLEGRLYFPVGIKSEEAYQTNLYAYNPEKRKLKKALSGKDAPHPLYLQGLGDQALVYKSNPYQTGLRAFRPSTGKVDTLELGNASIGLGNVPATRMLQFATQGDSLYTLVRKTDHNQPAYFLMKYDRQGLLRKTYTLKGFDELTESSAVGTMKIMGDYVYFQDYGPQAAILGKLVGDEVKPVVTFQGDLELAKDSSNDPTDYYLFVERGTEHFYALDLRNETWLEVPLPHDPLFNRFGYTVTDGQQHILILMDDKSGRTKLVYLNVPDFLPQAKQIGKLSVDHVIKIDSP